MRIAVLIPRYGDTRGPFTISLARMLVKTLGTDLKGPSGPLKIEIEIFSSASSDLPSNRETLWKAAIEWRASHALWLDADHVFPSAALLLLLQHRLPVVGCNYARRSDPTGPVAARINAAGEVEPVWTTAELARRAAVEEVAYVGLGLCLIDMAILPQLKAHVDKGPGWANWQPFEKKRVPGHARAMGEDVSFLDELRAAGVRIYVDHGLSWHVGHVSDRILTNADAEAQREAWLARRG